jgi:hypothetical protein
MSSDLRNRKSGGAMTPNPQPPIPRSEVMATVTLRNVTPVHRRGAGNIYRAVLSIYIVWSLLHRAVVRYAPKYQRGYAEKIVDPDDDWYDEARLLPINSPELQIRDERVNEIAVKYLKGLLFNPGLTWNARREDDDASALYEAEDHTLNIIGPITVPDSGHRHRAFFNLVVWKRDPRKVPHRGVMVNRVNVSREEILHLLDDFDPQVESVFVDVFTIDAKQEGHLYDEYNSDAKPPSTAVAIDLNPEKTPSRRFVYRVMEASEKSRGVLARREVETRRNAVALKSRKLVTNATLEGAVREFTQTLAELEADQERYDDLVSFFVAFFEEFATHYPEWDPAVGASAGARWELRKISFALSNMVFHPLSRMAIELWQKYEAKGTDWRAEPEWRKALARIAGEITTQDGDGKRWTGPILSRHNPDWLGKIIIRIYDVEGNHQDSMSNTRQTREAMYRYLHKMARL